MGDHIHKKCSNFLVCFINSAYRGRCRESYWESLRRASNIYEQFPFARSRHKWNMQWFFDEGLSYQQYDCKLNWNSLHFEIDAEKQLEIFFLTDTWHCKFEIRTSDIKRIKQSPTHLLKYKFVGLYDKTGQIYDNNLLFETYFLLQAPIS